jgi:dihydroneopterin aldolase
MLSTLAFSLTAIALCTPMITIALEGMRFQAPVGIYPEEALLGNEIVVDVYLNVATHQHRGESIKDSLNYETVYTAVKIILQQPAQLLETVCRNIIGSVSQLSKLIEAIQVRVSKLHPPLPGQVARVFVEEEWIRDE